MKTYQGIAMVALAGLLGLRPAAAQQAQPTGSMGESAIKPNPDEAGVYHNGPGMTMPKVISQVAPEYSEAARKKKINGDCLVALLVDTEGVPQNVRVIRSIAEMNPSKEHDVSVSLDEKAVEAVKQYRFKPAIYQGQPVPVELRIKVNFQIF